TVNRLRQRYGSPPKLHAKAERNLAEAAGRVFPVLRHLPRDGRDPAASLPARLGLVLVVGGTRARRSDEQFLAVRQGDVPPVRSGRSILGLVAFDEDLGSDWQRIFRKSSS